MLDVKTGRSSTKSVLPPILTVSSLSDGITKISCADVSFSELVSVAAIAETGSITSITEKTTEKNFIQKCCLFIDCTSFQSGYPISFLKLILSDTFLSLFFQYSFKWFILNEYV